MEAPPPAGSFGPMAGYHLSELEIALSPGDRRRIQPSLAPDERVLDVGCGAGQTLIAARPASGAIGVDVDVGALHLGRRLARDVALAAARAEALPFRDEAFDVVISRLALPYTNLPRALREIRRVLGSNGRVWLVLHTWRLFWATRRPLTLRALAYGLYVTLNSMLLAAFGRLIPYRREFYESFQTRGSAERLLRAHGFADVEFEAGDHFVVTARCARRQGSA